MHIRQQRRRLAAMAITAIGTGALAAATGPAAGAFATTASGPTWRIVSNTQGGALAVVAPGGASAWVFGAAGGFGKPEHPFARHWNGKRWSTAVLPGGLTGGIGCAGASSSRNVWAFNGTSLEAGESTAAALHRVHGRWVISHKWATPRYITSCAVLGPKDAWAFGSSHVGPAIGTWHLTGTAWTRVSTPGFSLASASAVSATDIWASGQDSLGTDNVVARWNGHTWRRNRAYSRALPAPASNVELLGGPITALSARNVYAETTVIQLSPRRVTRIVQHWNGTAWHRARPGSRGYYVPGSVTDGHGGRWSLGYAPSPAHPYLLHETGGRWTRVRISIPSGYALDISSVVNVPRTRSMLAAGFMMKAVSTGEIARAVVLAYGPLPH